MASEFTHNYRKYIEEENLIAYIEEINITDRDKEVVYRFLSTDEPLRKIGEQFDISGERVRQILVRFAKKAHGRYKKHNNFI